jgi:hypothetical protein
MAVSVELREGTLEIRAGDLIHYDEDNAHFSIPYGAIRRVRPGPYTPPVGSFTLANREVTYAEVKAGHFRQGTVWTFCAYDDPEQTVVVDLEDFDFALRPYGRVVVAADDPAALAEAMRARVAKDTGPETDLGPPEVAWTGLGAGMAVLSKEGVRVGTVTHPLGDIAEDVFEGVAFRIGTTGVRSAGIGAMGMSRMARPEDIARLTEAAVELNVSAQDIESLPPVQLEDLREIVPGRGIFRHHPGWRRDNRWNDPEH